MSLKQLIFFLPAMLFFIRFLMQYTYCDYYHPFCRFITKITDPFINIFHFEPKRNLNINALACCAISVLLFGSIYFIAFSGNLILQNPIRVFLTIICIFLYLITYLFLIILIITALLSWIPTRNVQYYNYILMKLISPMINPLNRIVPSIGVISLSYIVAFFIIHLMQWIIIQIINFIWSFNGFA